MYKSIGQGVGYRPLMTLLLDKNRRYLINLLHGGDLHFTSRQSHETLVLMSCFEKDPEGAGSFRLLVAGAPGEVCLAGGLIGVGECAWAHSGSSTSGVVVRQK
jgi:hypothetical protein